MALSGLLASTAFAGPPGPPVTEPVDVNVTNPVLQVEVSNADPIEVTGQVGVASAPVTHMGQNVAEHVSLSTGSGSNTTCPSGQLAAFRKFSDGSSPSPFGEFVVPDGKTFVITDLAIGIRERAGNDWVAGNNLISFQLRIGPGAIDNLWGASIQIDDLMARSEEAWYTEHLVSGVAVGPGQRICIKAGFSFSATDDTVSLINLSRVYGYLVAN
jgi:hypothetical protein